jgi:hypothetical protein
MRVRDLATQHPLGALSIAPVFCAEIQIFRRIDG